MTRRQPWPWIILFVWSAAWAYRQHPLSTALLVLGPEAGARWAESRPDLGVLFLLDDNGRVKPRWNHALEQYLVMDSNSSRGG